MSNCANVQLHLVQIQGAKQRPAREMYWAAYLIKRNERTEVMHFKLCEMITLNMNKGDLTISEWSMEITFRLIIYDYVTLNLGVDRPIGSDKNSPVCNISI